MPDVANTCRAAAILGNASPANNFQVCYFCQIREDVVLNPIGKVSVFFIVLEIFKGQNGDAFLQQAGGADLVGGSEGDSALPDPGAEANTKHK